MNLAFAQKSAFGARLGRGLLACTFFCALSPLHAEENAPEVIGFSEPVETIELSAAEPGVVEQMHVKEGDKVEAGQLLGRLDTGVMEASLKIAEAKAGSQAAITSAQARLDLRRSRWQKLKQLASSSNANPEELERADADLKIAEADLQNVEEEKKASILEVTRIREGINRRTFRSPIHGVVVRVLRDVAESVDTRTDHVLTIVNLDQLRIIVYVSPASALRLRASPEVKVHPAEGGPDQKAEVEFVSPVTEPASGTVRVKVLLANPEGQFISGTKFAVTLP